MDIAPAARVTVSSYRDDPMYRRIARAVAAILAGGTVVAPVEVLVRMDLLKRSDLENWRRGRVPYLERVVNCNLTRLNRLLRILRFYAHDLRLMPSETVYMRHGKGPKQRLRFSKTGDPRLERAYATHLVWPGKGPFHPPKATAHEAGAEVSRGSNSTGPDPAIESPVPAPAPDGPPAAPHQLEAMLKSRAEPRSSSPVALPAKRSGTPDALP